MRPEPSDPSKAKTGTSINMTKAKVVTVTVLDL